MAKYTTEQFITKCKEKWGDKYDYSESKYEGLEKPFTFKCPEHGEVTHKEAKKHLVRSGCPLCDEEKAKKLSEDLDLYDGLKLSVQHCQEVMEKNAERYPLLEQIFNLLTARNADLKESIESHEKMLAKLNGTDGNGEE